MATISVIIHTYNSEKYLKICLESVKQADEIIICDMYSNDKTIEIAKEFGCKIIYHENVGFADPARDFAMSHASCEWLLVVDSDELIPQELWDYLRDFSDNPPENTVGLEIPRKNYLLGKLLWSWYPNTIQRFWKRGCVSWPARVHETPDTLNGELMRIDPKKKELAIIHYNYSSVESFISRTNKYTTLELQKYNDRNVKFTLALLIFRPIGEFFKKFILKQGYKDGIHGFIFSVLSATYKFIAIAKLYEQEYKEKNPDLIY